jgi:hypothetical protein
MSLDHEEKGPNSPNSNTKRYNTRMSYAMPVTNNGRQTKKPQTATQCNVVCGHKLAERKGTPWLNAENGNVMRNTKQKQTNAPAQTKNAQSLTLIRQT